MKYVLDTDTCICALKRLHGVLEQMLTKNRSDVALSVITEAELRTGAAKSASPVKALRLLENFLRPITVLEFTSDDAVAYATIRSKLERSGTPIGPLDTLIASQAASRKLTLVSNNLPEFQQISGLRLENWAQ